LTHAVTLLPHQASRPGPSRACLGEAVIEQIREAVATAIATGTVLDVAETATRIAGACRAEPAGVADEMIETGLRARINMLMDRP
jgi:hypothetical protein